MSSTWRGPIDCSAPAAQWGQITTTEQEVNSSLMLTEKMRKTKKKKSELASREQLEDGGRDIIMSEEGTLICLMNCFIASFDSC